MVYWLVSLPVGGRRRETTWELLQEKTSGSSSNYKLDIPELRVGTLDTLMALSDELSKTTAMVEAVVSKIRRQVNDTGGLAAVSGLKVEAVSTDTYVQRFKWDEAKFPARRPLKEAVEKMAEVVSRIEDDLKVKSSEYNNLKSQLGQVTRKSQGSLAVRDVSTVVKPSMVIDTEHLITLFVVVSKFAVKEWDETYEKMCSFVVPRSSKCVAEDSDYSLVSVVLFKRVLDDFKAAARSKGYQVREYHAPAEAGELSAGQAEQLKKDVEQRKAGLEQWCKTAYGEAFSCYMHVLVVRLFVETILRYGLPPAYQAAVMRPAEKSEAKLRAELANTFSDGKASYWKDDGASNVGAGLMGDTEMYPYVSLTLSVDYVS